MNQPQLGQVWRYKNDPDRKYIVHLLPKYSVADRWVNGVVYQSVTRSLDYYARPLDEFLLLFNYVKEDNDEQ